MLYPRCVCLASFTYALSAGLTYCAIDALAFLYGGPEGRLGKLDAARSFGVSFDDCTRWILARQTTYLDENEPETDEQTSQLPPPQPEAVHLPSFPLGSPHAANFQATPQPSSKATSSARPQNAKAPILDFSKERPQWAGFSGRPNKVADTCYCFWNTGALAVRILGPFWLQVRMLTGPHRCCVVLTLSTKPACEDICSKRLSTWLAVSARVLVNLQVMHISSRYIGSSAIDRRRYNA